MEQRSSGGSIPAVLILALGFVAGCWLIGRAIHDFKAMDRYVTVKGLAEREVPADLAVWPVSFSEGGDTLTEVQEGVERSTKTIITFLAEQGLERAEVILAAPQIVDRAANNPGNPPLQRYYADSVVTVRSPQIDLVKQAMAAAGVLVARGVQLVRNYEYQPRFMFTGFNAIKPEMIAEATKDARRAASQFAADSGSAVGDIRGATQGLFSITDRDQYTPEVKLIRVVNTVQYYLE